MAQNRYRVLVVEDEGNILSFMATMLEAKDYQVLTARTAAEGMLLFRSHNPDLMILDLGLPDGDGLDVVKAVRETSSAPILILSARMGENDKVQALDLGANDYITKPFSTAELLARVRAALRNRGNANGSDSAPSDTLTIGNLSINYDSRRIFARGEEVKLTQTEYNILVLLAENRGKVLTYSSIIKAIWGATDDGSIKKLQVNMSNIRRKLNGELMHRYIHNELGVGYRMLDENEQY